MASSQVPRARGIHLSEAPVRNRSEHGRLAWGSVERRTDGALMTGSHREPFPGKLQVRLKGRQLFR